MKEWDKLKVFYHVAKIGNITQASKEIKVAQPSVSRTIRLLEERIGATLFQRVARGVNLTKEGKILFVHASKIFAEVDAALKFIDNNDDIFQKFTLNSRILWDQNTCKLLYASQL